MKNFINVVTFNKNEYLTDKRWVNKRNCYTKSDMVILDKLEIFQIEEISFDENFMDINNFYNRINNEGNHINRSDNNNHNIHNNNHNNFSNNNSNNNRNNNNNNNNSHINNNNNNNNSHINSFNNNNNNSNRSININSNNNSNNNTAKNELISSSHYEFFILYINPINKNSLILFKSKIKYSFIDNS